MANLILPSRRIIQPQDVAVADGNLIDLSKAIALVLPSISPTTNLINNFFGLSATVSSANVIENSQGRGVNFNGGSGYISLGNADSILDNTSFTMLLSTVRTGTGSSTSTSYGYEASATDRAMLHSPFTDNTLYFDYGNSTTGRVSTPIGSYLATGTINNWCFIAGSRGREIWRNGVLLASAPSALATRTSSGSREFRLGKSDSSFSIAPYEIMNLAFVSREQIDQETAAKLTANPWQIFAPQNRVLYFDVGASAGYTLTTDPTSYSVSGQTSLLLRNSLLVGGSSTFSLDGQAATLTYTASSNAYVLTSSVGSFIFIGASASLLRDGLIYGGPNSFNIVGQTAALLKTSVIAVENTPFTLSGQTIPLLKGSKVIGEAPVFIFNGNAAPLLANRVITAVPSNYTLTGQTATLLYTQAGAYILPADGAAFTYSGQAANTLLNRILTSSLGSFIVSGIPAILLRGLSLPAGVNNHILSGQSATLTYIGGYTLVCGSSSYTLSAQQAQLILNRVLSASPSGYSIIGKDVNFVKGIAESVGSSHIWNIVIKSPDNSMLVKGLDSSMLVKSLDNNILIK